MKFGLKTIKYAENLSEETNAFTANLHLNNKKVGYANNRGHGGATDVRVDKEYKDAVLSHARAWLDVLDPYPVDHSVSPTRSEDGRTSIFTRTSAENRSPSSPEGYLCEVVDILLTNSLIIKDMKKVQAKTSFLTKNSEGGSYASYNRKPSELSPDIIRKIESDDDFVEWLYCHDVNVIARKLGVIDQYFGPLSVTVSL